MENTTKAGTFNLVKTGIIRVLLMITLTFLVSHVPITEQCFPPAIALVAYLVSKNTVNIYLVIPAAAGVLPYVVRGYDPWGDLAAMCVCGILFVAARRLRIELWQRALISASVTIICISIYRLATGTVYKMELQSLIFEGVLVFLLIFIFDAFYGALQSNKQQRRSTKVTSDRFKSEEGRCNAVGAEDYGTAGFDEDGNQCFQSWERVRKSGYDNNLLPVAAFAVVSLLVVCGAGLGFFIWPVIIFLSLWGIFYMDTGQALFMVTVMGGVAALVDQAQWGFAVTLFMGLGAAVFAKRAGALAGVAVFVLACWALGSVEKGLVLGIESYSLFLASAGFLTVNWRLGAKMKKVAGIFAGNAEAFKDKVNSKADVLLRRRAGEMEKLSELYHTYLDNRSLLADQFNITGQIIEDVRWQIAEQERNAVRFAHEKIELEIAASQCAAAGSINGDCCGWQDMGDGRTAMVVSDGMGKGKKAAAESLLVTKTIMGFLKSGVMADMTLKMINTIMLMKEDSDSFATVDLIIIDRKTCKAKFYKIGAAPTLIRRKNNVEEVQLSTVPLGIVNGLKIRYVETTLKKDDRIIMMSDGVSDGGEAMSRRSRGDSKSVSNSRNGRDTGSRRDGRGFLQNIKFAALNIKSSDPQTMCDLLMNQAADSYIGRERDDLTVMVAYVK